MKRKNQSKRTIKIEVSFIGNGLGFVELKLILTCLTICFQNDIP
jgi:hypothetical protein